MFDFLFTFENLKNLDFLETQEYLGWYWNKGQWLVD